MDYPLELFRKQAHQTLRKVLTIYNYKGDILFQTPPLGMGDLAFPCFSLASAVHKSPHKIACSITEKIKAKGWIKKIESKGGYINFFIDDHRLTTMTLQLILELKKQYGYHKKKQKKVIIEHTSVNPNGPLHVGRARNPIIGDTLVRLYQAAGYTVESQFYLDDMGKQVAALTWGVQKLSPEDIPKSHRDKPDHQRVGFYQAANRRMKQDKTIALEISNIVKQCETGDQKMITTAHQAYAPVLKGIQESLRRINIAIDKYVPESNFVRDNSVDAVVTTLKKTPYCQEEDGAFFLDLASFGIQGRNTKFFFTRKDGTTLYATRDIAYHLWKAKHADILINILGEDHKLESKQVAIALELVGAKRIPRAIFYAFVSLPGGKMSTRQGRVVYLDDLIDEAVARAYEAVKQRRSSDLTEEKMNKIATIIGIGSLRYNIIKVQPEKDIVFRWEDALNIEGNAAPFIQYAHARACNILVKTQEQIRKEDIDGTALRHPSEQLLIKALAQFSLLIEEASTTCKPHILPTYLYETASSFNQFYRDCPVLPEPNPAVRKTRLVLVDATRIVLRNGLELLGIIAPEEM